MTKDLKRVQIILVSALPNYQAINTFRLKTAGAINDALRDAFGLVSKNARVWAIPYGNITLPVIKTDASSLRG